MSRFAMPCIACGRELENVDEGSTNQPYGGTTFTSYGHYGSTIYDPMDGHYIEVNVCDLCLASHASRVLIGRDWRPVTEEGSVVGMERLSEPLKLVRWHIRRAEFDHTVETTRKEFQLVSDEPSEGEE